MPHQLPILSSPSKHKIVACGRRFGKTTLSLIACIIGHGEGKLSGLKDGANIWWVSPTYGQSSRVWRDLKSCLREGWKDKSEVERWIELPNGAMITVKSADRPDLLRGEGLHGVVLDEAAFMDEEVWKSIILPSLADYDGWSLMISTPNGLNWFYDEFTSAAPDSKWQRPTTDNPKVTRHFIEKVKEKYGGDRSPIYRQEFLAEFFASVGLVYPQFGSGNIIPPHDIPRWWGVVEGIDFGAKNPTAVTWIATDGDTYEAIAEYVRSDALLDEHVKAIQEVRRSVVDARGMTLHGTFIDPSARQIATEFAERGILCNTADNDVVQGISRVYGLLSSGKLKVWETCPNLIAEFGRYRWAEGRGADGSMRKEKTRKEYDHSQDSLRYGIMGARGLDVRKPTEPWDPFYRKAHAEGMDMGIPIDRLISEGPVPYYESDDLELRRGIVSGEDVMEEW